jgi:hypothetical protein
VDHNIPTRYVKSCNSTTIKKKEIGWECGMYGGEERCIQGLVETPEGKETIWENQIYDIKMDSMFFAPCIGI